MDNKIIKISKIKRFAETIKKSRKKIATFNGSFDILHVGHVNALFEAKSYGDLLIVILNSDNSIKKYKGPNRPIVNQSDRAKMLASLSCVDYVVLFDDLNPRNILKLIKPDIHCSGPEWGEGCIGNEEVRKYGGRIKVLKRTEGFSSTFLIENIIKNYKDKEQRTILIDPAIFFTKNGKYLGSNNHIFNIISRYKKQKFRLGLISVLLNNNDVNTKDIIDKNLYTKIFDFRIDISGDIKSGKRQEEILKKYIIPNKIILARTYIISSRSEEMLFGREFNTKTIKIGSRMENSLLQPNFYIKEFSEILNIIK